MTPADELLLASFQQTQLARNDVPDAAVAADRERCLTVLAEVLGPDLQPDGLRHCALGAAWTDVFEAHLRRGPDEARLRGRGWLPVDVPGIPAGTWAVVEDARVLAAVRLSLRPPAPPAEVVLDRCRRQGEVRLRDVLELRVLRREGAVLPTSSPVLRAAAEVESALDGRDLAPWASGRSEYPPVPLPRSGRPAARHLVVAISGVDGSGKSSLRAALTAALRRLGVPVTVVWIRPGMGLGGLAAVAVRVKRLLGQDTAPGIRAVAEGGGDRLRSRRGAVGWLWALVVTLSYLSGVWRQQRAGRGVVLHDRHLVDALATLDFAYEGVDLRVHRWLLRAVLPRATVGVYLDVPADVAVARKPDDVIGASAVRRQLEAYEHWLADSPGTFRVDATLPPAEVALQALALVLRSGPRRRPGRPAGSAQHRGAHA